MIDFLFCKKDVQVIKSQILVASESGALDTTNYGIGDHLQTDYIIFPSVFGRCISETVELKAIEAFLFSPSQLQFPEFQLLLFNRKVLETPPIKNNPFLWAGFDFDYFLEAIEFSAFESIGDNYYRAKHSINKYIQSDGSNFDVFGVGITKTENSFLEGAKLFFALHLKR